MGSVAVALLVASGSIAYYYIYFLPQNQMQSQEDISAIRSVVAPTQEQQQAAQKSEAQLEAALNAYMKCLTDMVQKSDTYISAQCGKNDDLSKYMQYFQCSSNIQKTTYYQQHYTCKSPYSNS